MFSLSVLHKRFSSIALLRLVLYLYKERKHDTMKTEIKNILCIQDKHSDFRQCTKLNVNVQLVLWHNGFLLVNHCTQFNQLWTTMACYVLLSAFNRIEKQITAIHFVFFFICISSQEQLQQCNWITTKFDINICIIQRMSIVRTV